MASNRKNQICALLKGIETGDAAAVAVVNEDKYIQHNPQTHEGSEGLPALRSALSDPASGDGITIQYNRIHRLLAEGDFVLSVSEGSLNGVHSSFYDLYRVSHGKLVEHWDTTEAIPPRGEWKNDNGKF